MTKITPDFLAGVEFAQGEIQKAADEVNKDKTCDEVTRAIIYFEMTRINEKIDSKLEI